MLNFKKLGFRPHKIENFSRGQGPRTPRCLVRRKLQRPGKITVVDMSVCLRMIIIHEACTSQKPCNPGQLKRIGENGLWELWPGTETLLFGCRYSLVGKGLAMASRSSPGWNETRRTCRIAILFFLTKTSSFSGHFYWMLLPLLPSVDRYPARAC